MFWLFFCLQNRIPSVRKVLSKAESSEVCADHKLYLTGAATAGVDAVDKIYGMFGTEIALTCSIVFIIVGLVFKSFFVPLRLLVTIALPICLTYGLAVLVFQQGLLWGWKKTNAIYWLAPVMSFSVLVGLGLDYDVFLFSRIYEYRQVITFACLIWDEKLEICYRPPQWFRKDTKTERRSQRGFTARVASSLQLGW